MSSGISLQAHWPTMKKDAQKYVKKGQLKFVAVAVEYFTKWVEAEPLTTISKPRLRRFDHRLTSISHPQSNGLVEVTNQIILQDLRTRIGYARGYWSDELPSKLWTYRTSHRTATKETPFMLAFGIEATIPVEVRLPSQRRLEPEDVGRTTEHLDLLEEVCDQAALRMTSY
ncbi:uncharacterized protein LOC111395089 [Olea europaea var. sylvestris]|uniref:uncharacterized protein LOC111395089 n=1 Tax=Olea europaea var. sylvestris TaxID=158386 RepID=UPI000C1D0828|nr:uncharacterized protein LOC111395089 [Olea europaea var. sylvestris]